MMRFESTHSSQALTPESGVRLIWPALLTAGGAGVALAFSLHSFDALFAFVMVAVGLMLWVVNFRVALAYGLIALFAKSFLMRVAFYLDLSAGHDAGRWLAPAPAILLAVLCAYALVRMIFADRSFVWNRPAVWMIGFAGFAVLTLLLPLETMRVKLGGFERNIFPTMALAAAGWWAYRNPQQLRGLGRTLMVFGIVSIGYALWQHLVGLPVWERAWFEVLSASTPTGLSGWVTIGASGLEFRVHSLYYSYTEFFFTTVGILLLNGAQMLHEHSRTWRRVFVIFALLFVWLLAVTLERMPIVMLLAGGLSMWAVHGGRAEMKRRIMKSAAIVFAIWLVGLVTLSAYLHSGVDKLVRLAELTNPFAASSIQDRISNQWATTLSAIAEQPWGWGLGSGSQTQASSEAKQIGTYVQPHNEILQKTLELGLVGGILFLGLIVSLWLFAARRLLDCHDPPDRRYLVLGYFGVMVAFFVCGMVNLTMSGTMGMLFWTITGAAWSLTQSDEQVT